MLQPAKNAEHVGTRVVHGGKALDMPGAGPITSSGTSAGAIACTFAHSHQISLIRVEVGIVSSGDPLHGYGSAGRHAWPKALAAWSRHVVLHAPSLWPTIVEAEQEGLTESFAMIRLADQSIIINLADVERHGLGDYAEGNPRPRDRSSRAGARESH